ncbi:hypothetical protein [Pseudalkalibacillus caeni]|uniref:Radical SAM protein n=1 Tax=Exobacillus caeni TaxID=2574798 RepID=A0A5R9FE13_9BACL|nr:hypothetical protein [Pseudalkalibacillus caeni]TLS39113.1 hypothetical protein FCL54_02030 [Pseudalkalibacillus caeni]
MVEFVYNPKLGIKVPVLHGKWNEIPSEQKEKILFEWEKIRGEIPDRIAEIEKVINTKQSMLGEEENFSHSCRLNEEIAELASAINDLWLLYRSEPIITKEKQAGL